VRGYGGGGQAAGGGMLIYGLRDEDFIFL